MLIESEDFNNASKVIKARFLAKWNELEAVLQAMPLHLKASDQAGRQGTPIFNPVGTNAYIKEALRQMDSGWLTNIPIPQAFDFLGTDVDYGHQGLIAEAQFSNYPFLLNNVIRSELFYKSKTPLSGAATGAVIIITKGGMFPSSNSTLYYEQAIRQVRALAENNVFEVPMRIVGLKVPTSGRVPAKWTTYHTRRYSRTVLAEVDTECEVGPGRLPHHRYLFRIIEG